MKDNKIAGSWRNKGNLFYHAKDFRKAMIAYNKSLCYSEPGSEQVALAYANRSAVYLEVELYDACLENLQKARDHNYPGYLKLTNREKKCLEARKHQPNKAAWFQKLSHTPNAKMPFIADYLELRVNKKFGRHVITTRDLRPGDIISIEKPAIKTLESFEERYKRCIYCLEPKRYNLIPCERCSVTMFCSENCVGESMKDFHKLECEHFIRNHLPNSPIPIFIFTTMRFLSESVSTAASMENLKKLMNNTEPVTCFDFNFTDPTDNNLDWNRLRVINGLLPSENPDRISIFKTVADSVIDSSNISNWGAEDSKTVSDYLLRLMLIFDRNNFGKSDETGNDCSKFLYMFGSMLNHSCVPNTSTAIMGAKLLHFVIKPIKQNEQIFVSYSPYKKDRSERKAHLLFDYNFECSCAACLLDYPPGELMPSIDAHFDSWFENSLPKNPSDWKLKMAKLSDYIVEHFKSYPSKEIEECVKEIKFLFKQNCEQFEWPSK